MRIATWNVNSVRARSGRIVDFLERHDIDVLCMQEIKCPADQFPYEAFDASGYRVEAHGVNQWNGVALASRLPMFDVTRDLPAQPGYANTGDPVVEPRAIGATVEGLELWSLYVPNGRELDHPHYGYKLRWLDTLTAYTRARAGRGLALLGDFNIAPRDADVWDMSVFEGATHVSAPERAAFQGLIDAGLTDVVRPRSTERYTYWDYKAGRWQKDEGMRIDFVLADATVADLVTGAQIVREERAGDAPSDHVPVVVDLDLTTDLDDDRPMIF